MTAADALAKVKAKYNIPTGNTAFDTFINGCVSDAIDLLSPFVNRQVAVDVTKTIASGDQTMTIPLTGSTVNKIYIKSTSSDTYELFDAWSQIGDTINFSKAIGDSYATKIYAEIPFTVSTIANIPAGVLPPMIKMACAEFAEFLAANKSQYNIYLQATGARAVDNLLDLSEWWESKAQAQLRRYSTGVVL